MKLPQKLSNETVFQLKILGKTLKVLWTSTKGYSHTDQLPKLLHQFDFIKSIINKKALSAINSRLCRLEIEFIITSKGKVYCLAITKYQYSEIKFLSYFQSLNTTPIQKSAAKSPILFPLTPDPLKTLEKKFKTRTPRVLGDKLSNLMQSSESIKYMRYSQWKLAVDSGNKLLSNERLYSKKLAGISTRVLVQSTKNVKEMRKMAGIMRKSLHRRESYIDANEIAKLRDNMFIDNYIINLNEGHKSRKKDQKNIKKTIKLIIDDASNKLDSLKSRSISQRFDLGKA